MIFFGLEIMSGAFKPLRDAEGFRNLMLLLDAQSLPSLLGCVAIGCLMTMVIQSSSAMLGITIALASTGAIPMQTAVALVLGENIGTTITAQLAALGSTCMARRTAMAHSLFNVVGVLIIISLFSPFISLVEAMVPGAANYVNSEGGRPYVAAHIAFGHSFFNIAATLVMLPFVQYLEKLVVKIIPDKGEAGKGPFKYFGPPGSMPVAMGVSMVNEELKRMLGDARQALQYVGSLLQPDLKGRDRFCQKIKAIEEEADIMQKEITTFTASLMQAGKASQEQADRAYAYIRAADELETITDYAASICNYLKRLEKNDLDFSEDGWKDLSSFHIEVSAFFTLVGNALQNEEAAGTSAVLKEAARLNELANVIRDAHLVRMKSGSCSALSALIFSDMAIALRRIKNHTVNLHEALSVEIR
jgi:phosphate:Na+ symporter